MEMLMSVDGMWLGCLLSSFCFFVVVAYGGHIVDINVQLCNRASGVSLLNDALPSWWLLSSWLSLVIGVPGIGL